MSLKGLGLSAGKGRRIIVIGLDSLDWEFVDSHPGSFPNLLRYRNQGLSGDLRSTHPPVTAPAWVSFATGMNPGNHGCYDFTVPDKHLGGTKAISARDIGSPTVYEILERSGKKSVLVNLPVTYPPRSSQVTITSLLTRGPHCIFPAEIRCEIRKYRIVPDFELRMKGEMGKFYADISEVERVRFETGKRLFSQIDWDLFFILFSGTDIMLHTRRSGYPEFPSDLAWEAFGQMDEYVGWFLERAVGKTGAIVMSDHGSSIHNGYFNLNEWLRARGYLKWGVTEEPFDTHIIERQKRKSGIKINLHPGPPITDIINASPLCDQVTRTILAIERRFLKPVGIKLKLRPTIMPAHTRAFVVSPSSWGIYLNRQDRFEKSIVGDGEYDALRDEIIAGLLATRDQNGAKVVEYALKGNEVYFGKQVGIGPDIIFKLARRGVDTKAYGPIFTEDSKGSHSLNGIVTIIGPGINPGNLDGARIIDLAPTILEFLGENVPEMDGKCLIS